MQGPAVTASEYGDSGNKLLAEEEEDTEPLLARLATSENQTAEGSTSGRCSWSSVVGLVWNSGVTCMAIAAFIQSLAALFVKLTGGRVPVFELVAIRSGLCMTATIAAIKWRGLPHMFGDHGNFWPLFIRGAAGALSMSLYYFAIFKLSLADVMSVFFTHPAMVLVLAWLCRGERVGLLGFVGILSSLAGVLLVAQPPVLTGGTEWSTEHVAGVSLCVAAAFLAAVAFVAIRYVPKTEASFSIALWFHAMGFGSAIIPLLAGIPEWPIFPAPLDLAMLIGVAMCSFTSHAFIARAFLATDNASKVAAAGFLQVVFAHVYGIWLLHDSESMFGILGSLVICIGVVAVSWPARVNSLSDQPHIGEVIKGTHADEVTVLEMSPLVDPEISLEESKEPCKQETQRLEVQQS